VEINVLGLEKIGGKGVLNENKFIDLNIRTKFRERKER
jgi:hypothetical protein